MKRTCQCKDDIADENGNTALHYAISYQEFEMAKKLISLGVDVCAANSDQITPLQLAIANRIPIGCLDKRTADLGERVPLFSLCLDSYDCAVKARNDKVLKALGCNRIRSDDDNRKLVKMLLDAGADVNSKDLFECSPIHCAVCTGDLELVNILIDAGADVNGHNDLGVTALHYAVLCRNVSMVQLLLNRGAFANVHYDDVCEPPLFWASMLNWGNDLDVIIRTLLEAGADLNQSRSSDLNYSDSSLFSDSDFLQTPFHYILMYGDIDLVNLCIEKYNADLKLTGENMDENDALKFAVYNEDISVMNLMLEKGITKCTYGLTALHLASLWFRPQHVQQLITNGDDVDTLVRGDYDLYSDFTPLALLADNTTFSNGATQELYEALECEMDRPNAAKDRMRTIKVLLDSGANLNQKIHERTTLEIAISSRLANSEEPDVAEHLIIEHAVLVEARTKKKVLDEYNLKLIEENPSSKAYYEKCQAELTAMRNSKIVGTSITYFSVLTKPLELVARNFKNEKFVQEFEANYREAYPVYAWRLKEKYEVARARQQKTELALFALSRMLKFADPSFLAFETVLKYLTNEDFDSLINCFTV